MTLDDFSLADIAPDSIMADGQVISAIKAIDPELHAAASLREIPAVLHRLDGLSSAQLDHVAAWFDAPTWNDSWSLALKRSVIRTVIDIKRHQGTPYAIRQALSSIGGSCSMTEWWQMSPPGTPHTFVIEVSMSDPEAVTTTDIQALVKALIDAAKPVRSQYEFLVNAGLKGAGGGDAYARGITETRLSNF
jgi:phage tail P2-like protein